MVARWTAPPSVDHASLNRFARLIAPQLTSPLTLGETVALYGRVVELRSPTDLARYMGMKISSVRVLLWRAKRKLGRSGWLAWEGIIAEIWYAAGIAEGLERRAG